MRSFADELRAILIPERKWHYIFHLMVMLVASSYWIGSWIKQSDATWAELAMYRPRGDNEMYPVITALSRLNFGDPTDALHYGEGTAASQVVILFPHALAYALFGVSGYMLADIGLTWVFFVAIMLLLRRCQFSSFSTLFIGSALATRSFQVLGGKVGESLGSSLSLSELSGTWEWGFPNLFELQIFVQRIPRPMITGIIMVVILYFLLRQWQERTLPTLRRGFVIGGLFAILLQGDPFAVAALGLLLLWILGWSLAANGWKFPGRFLIGGGVGALTFGWYFLWQRALEHPDSAVRFGVADYARDKLWLLPGYAPLLRVGVVCFLAGLVILAARRIRRDKATETPADHLEQKKSSKKSAKSDEKSPVSTSVPPAFSMEIRVATFCIAMVITGWLAQPVQLFLLGKGCQIYHYLIYTVPTLYAYAVVILLFLFIKLAAAPELTDLVRRLAHHPRWPGGVLLFFVFLFQVMVGMQNKASAVTASGSSRGETNVPWFHAGELYRPCFRALEKVFREDPRLKQSRTFATICYEVNFLLTAFHDKRAYLPDNAYSTLSDDELENRLCETLKIMQLPPDQFHGFVQVNFILNYWLGCAKYWMTSDHQYSTLDDYTAEERDELKKQAKQSPWLLCMPQSDMRRIKSKYEAVYVRPPDYKTYPDTLILGLEKSIGLTPNPTWYEEIYTNQLFSVYVKLPETPKKPEEN